MSLREERHAMRLAVQERLSGALIGAFGLIAGLAWNDAVKSTIDYFFPPGQSAISSKFIYAIVVTIFVSICIYFISKWLVPKKEEGK